MYVFKKYISPGTLYLTYLCTFSRTISVLGLFTHLLMYLLKNYLSPGTIYLTYLCIFSRTIPVQGLFISLVHVPSQSWDCLSHLLIYHLENCPGCEKTPFIKQSYKTPGYLYQKQKHITHYKNATLYYNIKT